MPTYEYICEACKHKFELLQNMKDEPVKKCPKCGKPKAKRMISAGTGVIFKGKGFYQTDYKSGSAGKDKENGGKKPACGKSDACSSCSMNDGK